MANKSLATLVLGTVLLMASVSAVNAANGDTAIESGKKEQKAEKSAAKKSEKKAVKKSNKKAKKKSDKKAEKKAKKKKSVKSTEAEKPAAE